MEDMRFEPEEMLREVAADLGHFCGLYADTACRIAILVFLSALIIGCGSACRRGNVFGQIRYVTEKAVLLALLSAYGTMIVGITLLSRSEGGSDGVNLRLFGTFHNDFTSCKYICENILLLFPCAVLLYGISHMFRRGVTALLTGFCVSLAIETAQLVTHLGRFEVDDILTNVTGYMAGYLLCYAFSCMRRLCGLHQT